MKNHFLCIVVVYLMVKNVTAKATILIDNVMTIVLPAWCVALVFGLVKTGIGDFSKPGHITYNKEKEKEDRQNFYLFVSMFL